MQHPVLIERGYDLSPDFVGTPINAKSNVGCDLVTCTNLDCNVLSTMELFLSF